jgi:hypothetical protein
VDGAFAVRRGDFGGCAAPSTQSLALVGCEIVDLMLIFVDRVLVMRSLREVGLGADVSYGVCEARGAAIGRVGDSKRVGSDEAALLRQWCAPENACYRRSMGQRYCLSEVADEQLLATLATLVRRSNELTSDLLAHLAEVDERRLHVEAGFSSLFQYCTERLRMSESVAGRRITAARVARKFARLDVFARVARGELNLTTLCALNPHLNQENAVALFEACSNRSRLQVEEILVARFPKADVRESVRRLPQVEALSPDRYGVHFTADAEFRELLEQARALASHQLPSGELNALLKLALKGFVRAAEKRRFGVARKARVKQLVSAGSDGAGEKRSHSPGEYGKRSRRIPAAVAREVYERDERQCGFVAKDGRRCGSRMFLEIDHRVPFALGGGAGANNLRLRCRAHNQWHTGRYFGTGVRTA